MPKSNLPPSLQNRPHNDWPKWLSWVPRGLTAWNWGEPKMVAGNQLNFAEGGIPKPIGNAGSWQISVFPNAPLWAKPFAWYMAATLPNGRHFRVGARWDDDPNGHYTQWPSIASRKYPPENNMERDTSS
jgi:hypothetical protein